MKWENGLHLQQFKVKGDSMNKFFVDSENVQENRIIITGDDVNHITKVLRLRKGEKIQISDGRGREYICLIEETGKKEIISIIEEVFDNCTESTLNITLFQGLPKSQKMEFIIQKCVEIGVKAVQPVITERVVVKTDNRDLSGKLERWQRISEEAAKQSDRGIIPKVLPPITFKEALEQLKAMDLAVVPYERENSLGLRDALSHSNNPTDIGILIGPEGGFEEYEIEQCSGRGVKSVTLGPRILRTETAGIVASTIILYQLGDMGGF